MTEHAVVSEDVRKLARKIQHISPCFGAWVVEIPQLLADALRAEGKRVRYEEAGWWSMTLRDQPISIERANEHLRVLGIEELPALAAGEGAKP